MSDLHFIYSYDETTAFLDIFRKNFNKNFYVILPNKESVKKSIEFISKIPNNDIIVFLGHGRSTGLYTPQNKYFEKEIFIDQANGHILFKNKKVILLSCNSDQFIRRLNSYQSIIGFGNILSSMDEVIIEAETLTGKFRPVEKEDIDFFNISYCEAIIKALKLVNDNLFEFKEIPKLIEFFINQIINKLLSDKANNNRKEIAKLFYEFRNEMVFKST